MKALCPTCGAPMHPPLSVGGTKRQMIFDIVRRRPHGISIEDIIAHVYADDPDGGPDQAPVSVRTMVCYINIKLEDAGYPQRISATGGKGSVYRMVNPDQTMHRFTMAQKLAIARDPRSARRLASLHRVSANAINYWRKTLAGKEAAR